MIAYTPEAYLRCPYSDTLGWENVTILEMTTTLWTDYGTTTSAELDHNLLHMKSQWTPYKTIMNLFTHTEEAILFSIEGNENTTKSHTVITSFTIITKIGLFPEAIRTWRTQ